MGINKSTRSRAKQTKDSQTRKERRQAKAANKTRMEKARADRFEAKTNVYEANNGHHFSISFAKKGRKK